MPICGGGGWDCVELPPGLRRSHDAWPMKPEPEFLMADSTSSHCYQSEEYMLKNLLDSTNRFFITVHIWYIQCKLSKRDIRKRGDLNISLLVKNSIRWKDFVVAIINLGFRLTAWIFLGYGAGLTVTLRDIDQVFHVLSCISMDSL